MHHSLTNDQDQAVPGEGASNVHVSAREQNSVTGSRAEIDVAVHHGDFVAYGIAVIADSLPSAPRWVVHISRISCDAGNKTFETVDRLQAGIAGIIRKFAFLNGGIDRFSRAANLSNTHE